jgi:hypothetical protein
MMMRHYDGFVKGGRIKGRSSNVGVSYWYDYS